MYIDAISKSSFRLAVTTEEILEFVEEMSDRFPDYSDCEILEYASEFRDESGSVISADCILGRAVLHAYKWGAKSATKMWLTNR